MPFLNIPQREFNFRADLTGNRFGKWTVLHPGEMRSGKLFWLCRCDCGTERLVIGSTLRNGSSKCCGCAGNQVTRRRSLTHGHTVKRSISKTYCIWGGMIQRCTNPNHVAYANYGGRGISVCSQWVGAGGFKRFLDDMGECPAGLTIERVNNDGNYDPSNCRWATRKEQRANMRLGSHARMLTCNGKTLSMAQWASESGIPYARLQARLRHGWSPERALFEPKIKNSGRARQR